MTAQQQKTILIVGDYTDAYSESIVDIFLRDSRFIVKTFITPNQDEYFTYDCDTDAILINGVVRLSEAFAKMIESNGIPVFLITDQHDYDCKFDNKFHSNKDYEVLRLYVFIKPIDIDMLYARMEQLIFSKELSEFVFQDAYFLSILTKAGKIIKRIGIPLHLAGFYYLRFALAYVYLRPNASWKRDIYPKLKQLYGNTMPGIERSMRYAIEIAWTQGNIDLQHGMFGYTIDENRGKPVVREFIATLADRMHISQQVE